MRTHILLPILVALVLAACDTTEPEADCDAARSVRITPETAPTLRAAGDTVRLDAAVVDGCDRRVDAAVFWLSSAPQVAEVVSGLVRAVGTGTAVIRAYTEGAIDSLDVTVRLPVATGLDIAAPARVRQGDVVRLRALLRYDEGAADTVAARWTLADSAAGVLTGDGRFVGYAAGAVASLVASARGFADTVTIAIEARGVAGSFSVLGNGPMISHFTSDLWVHGAAVYTGTWSCRSRKGFAPGCGNTVFVWDLSDPLRPTLADSVRVDAVVVNDVKVSPDGRFAVLTQEGSTDGRNGITVLGLADPLHPVVLTRYTEGLENGVHNVWIERLAGRDYVFAVEDPGPTPHGLHVLDFADPARPVEVAGYYAGTSLLHDVYVRDGLAFLSHWDAGLVILDVGHGVAGGSPASPTVVSTIRTAGGQTHNAWYWPAGGYVFVGEEDFNDPGTLHVVDVRDLRNPVEVAEFVVPGDSPHNFWLDEERGVLFAAWYTQGVRAVDVGGELMGALHLQGRELASVQPPLVAGALASPAAPAVLCHDDCGHHGEGGAATTKIWAPQLHGGRVYASDMWNGVWVLEFRE